MTNSDRNTRTLIICFVIAILALIPLRFAEEGQKMIGTAETSVLGEVEERVILPKSELDENSVEVVLEAPYDEIENTEVVEEEVEINDSF